MALILKMILIFYEGEYLGCVRESHGVMIHILPYITERGQCDCILLKKVVQGVLSLVAGAGFKYHDDFS